MAIFLNPVSKATDYYKSTKGVPPLQPDINDNTETSLEDTYYLKNLKKIPSQETTTNSNSKSTPEDSSSQEEQDSVKKVNEINRNITEENNATAADGANVTTSGKVVVNPLQGEYGPRNLEPGAQPEGLQVIEGGDGLPQDGAEQPVQPGVDGNGAEGNPVNPGVGDGGIGADPMNPVAGNPGIGNGGGLFGGRGLFGGWNPFGFLYSPRVFGNYLNPKIVNNTEDEDEPTHMKFLINDALKSNDPNKFVNIANHYMLGNSEMGLVQNPNKAWKYYEIAAEMNHPAAIHNIAIKGLESNLTYSLEMFER